ncbi:hypothetical protein F5146DRAFT_1218421 [Armillaria mellea]|nr:hypothetical protein F5146DRAFT_1218421 [Armillaria mellea]
MSSIVLPSRGQCIQITDGIQPCQCLWFFPPDSLLLDQNICGHCGHGIHTHADYISTVVSHYPANRCTAYAQKTYMMQLCTCGTQLFKHSPTYNSYRIPEPLTVLRYFNPDGHVPSPSTTATSAANSPFSPNTMPSSNYGTAMFSGDATDIPFTPAYMPSPSPNINPSHPNGDTVIFAPAPQSVVQLASPQIGAQEVEHSYGVQFQDDNLGGNDQDSRPRFSGPHSTGAWASQLD